MIATTQTALPGQMRPASQIAATSGGGRTDTRGRKSREDLTAEFEHGVTHHYAPAGEFMVNVKRCQPGDVEDAVRAFNATHRDWMVTRVMQDPIGGFSGSASHYPIALLFTTR